MTAVWFQATDLEWLGALVTTAGLLQWTWILWRPEERWRRELLQRRLEAGFVRSRLAALASPVRDAGPEISPVGVRSEPHACRVRFERSRRALVWQPGEGSLLDQALESGIGLPAGCRRGACGRCEVRVLAGRTGTGGADRSGVSTSAGSMRPCVDRPVGDLVLDA